MSASYRARPTQISTHWNSGKQVNSVCVPAVWMKLHMQPHLLPGPWPFSGAGSATVVMGCLRVSMKKLGVLCVHTPLCT